MRLPRSAAPLLIGLFLLASCHTGLMKPVRIDSSLEALIPADATYLLGANVEQLQQTPLYQKVNQLLLPEVDRVTRDTGIDPRKDIQEVLVCANETSVVTLVRGRFNTAQLESKLGATSVQRIPWKGTTMYGDDRWALTLLSPSILAGGSTQALKSALAARDASHGIPASLKPLVDAVPDRDQMWAVSASGIPGFHPGATEGSRLGDIAGMLRGIQNVLVGVDFSKGLNLTARLDCQTQDDARHVHDALRGAIGMARLSTPDNHPELLQVYDAIQVTQANSRVEVSGDLPADQVDRVLTIWLKKPR